MRVLAILLGVLAMTGCGGKKTASAPEVVRAWSAALDRNDNEQAANLFADGAKIIQNGEVILATHADAVRWNAALPCGGRITRLEVRGKDEVLAVFALDERPGHTCDGPGAQAATIFQVEDGRIVLWHQTPVPEQQAPGGQVI